MTYFSPVTSDDIIRLATLLKENEDASLRHVASLWGRSFDTTKVFRERILSGNFAPKKKALAKMGARGEVKIIFETLSSDGQTIRSIANALGADYVTIWNWYTGKVSPSLFNFQCLAQLAGFRMVLEAVNFPALHNTKGTSKVEDAA